MMPSLEELKLADFMQPYYAYEGFVLKLDNSLLEAQHCFMSALLDFLCSQVLVKAFDLDESCYSCKFRLLRPGKDRLSLHLSMLHDGASEDIFYSDLVDTGYFFTKNKLDASSEDGMLRAELVMMYSCLHTIFSGVYEVDLTLEPEVVLHESREVAGFTYTVEEEKTRSLHTVLPCFRTVEELLACFMLSGIDATFLDDFGKR